DDHPTRGFAALAAGADAVDLAHAFMDRLALAHVHRVAPLGPAGVEHGIDGVVGLFEQLLEAARTVALDVATDAHTALELRLHGTAQEFLDGFQGRPTPPDEGAGVHVDDLDLGAAVLFVDVDLEFAIEVHGVEDALDEVRCGVSLLV